MEEESAKSRKPGDRCGRSIEPVSHHGVAEARKVDPDLVRPAGPDAHFEVTEPIELLEQPVFRQRSTAGGEPCGHTSAANGIARNSAGNAPLRLFHAAVRKRQVDFFDLAIVKLRGQRPMCPIGSGDHEHSARLAIEAVHDAGPQVAIHAR